MCNAGFLQSVGAPTELHRRSVCHRQERQCAHFHRGEHEGQRAARASQRYESLELRCRRRTQSNLSGLDFTGYEMDPFTFAQTSIKSINLMSPWKQMLTSVLIESMMWQTAAVTS